MCLVVGKPYNNIIHTYPFEKKDRVPLITVYSIRTHIQGGQEQYRRGGHDNLRECHAVCRDGIHVDSTGKARQ